MIQDMMIGGASVEDTQELWSCSLRDVKGRLRPLFVAASAGGFLVVLLGDEPRKTGWMRAEAASDPGPWRQQALLGRGRWDAGALRDVVREHVVEHLAADDAVLVVDETGFLKQGRTSCGVGRQYTGSAGKITNCQIGVFAAYVSHKGHAFIDRALYLAKAWTSDPVRMSAGRGTKGERFYDWAYCPLADLDAEEFDAPTAGLWTRGLLIRRSVTDGEWATIEPFLPTDVRGKERHKIENAFCRLKDFRRIATHYDKLAANFVASVHLVATLVWWIL
jgi:SRSO17 transposase